MKFIERASLLGQDLDRLNNGEIISSLIRIKSIDDFRLLFSDNVSDPERLLFSESLHKLSDPVKIKQIPQATLTRLVDYVHGSGTLSTEDRVFADTIFPIKVEVISGDKIEINTNQKYGPSGAPYLLNAGNLIFNGGSLSFENTSASINADLLTVLAGGDKPYHIGLLGSVGTTGSTGAMGSSYSGPAAHGTDRSAASPGICTGVSSGGTGDDGGDGGNGLPGGAGGNGLPSLSANITITAFDSASTAAFSIHTQSGVGGSGGSGGQGGAGQDGGRGGNGCDSGCEGTDGGKGGKGGKGGNGGPGGSGGNGAAGLPITINFPNVSRQYLVTNAQSAPAGSGGGGGTFGSGGEGGSGGSGGKHSTDGAAGSPGTSGTAGATGPQGTQSGAPGQFIISYK